MVRKGGLEDNWWVRPDLGALDETDRQRAKELLRRVEILANRGWRFVPGRLRQQVFAMGARPSPDVGFGLLDTLLGKTGETAPA